MSAGNIKKTVSLVIGIACLVGIFAAEVAANNGVSFEWFDTGIGGTMTTSDLMTVTLAPLAFVVLASVFFFVFRGNRSMISYQVLLLSFVSFILCCQISSGEGFDVNSVDSIALVIGVFGTLVLSLGNYAK